VALALPSLRRNSCLVISYSNAFAIFSTPLLDLTTYACSIASDALARHLSSFRPG
jgi:hypothetical protein